MDVVKREAKTNAPGGADTTGNLKEGIKLAGEKSRYKGKKVYGVVFVTIYY